jgi:uncharacterized protein
MFPLLTPTMFSSKKSAISIYTSKECVILISSSVLLTLNYYYPIFYHDPFLYFLSALFYLFALPIGILILLRENPIRFGFTWIRWSFGIGTTTLIILAASTYIFMATSLPHISGYYDALKEASVMANSKAHIAISLGLYFFAWEFFFRGYLLFGLREKFGEFSIVIQAALFAVAHIGKPALEVLISPFAGLLLGYIAYRNRSFLPAFLIHWIMNLFY